MPISEVCMEGIRANGHKWRDRIRLGLEPSLLGRLNDKLADGEAVDDSEVERLTLRIVENVRRFAAKRPQYDSLERRADDLEMAADCGLEEVSFFMGELYDDFDWHRILVESPRLPTPDRSGEADKTENTGLAEGESGLPEGSSK
jgi:hypothetical protein